MSRLFQLKEWLTLEDAAKHLSTVFDEEVSKADALRLALDGRLKVSVNLVNGARGRPGKLVPGHEAQYEEVLSLDGERMIRLYRGPRLGNGDVIELQDEVVPLQGVFDLPMIGAEQLDVEHAYQALTDGPRITLSSLEGPFVTAGDDYFQLVQSWDDNEHVRGSRAEGEAIEAHISSNALGLEEATTLRAIHKEARAKFKEQQSKKTPNQRYYPADGLPEDAVLVVRKTALTDLLSSAIESERQQEAAQVDPRSETTYLNIIGAMLELLRNPRPGREKSDAAVIRELIENYSDKPGISKTSLENKFAAARRRLNST